MNIFCVYVYLNMCTFVYISQVQTHTNTSVY